jgi:hypothetical protein
MGQSFGNQLTFVNVATDASVRGIAQRQLWIAAARPDQALSLVLSVIPEGWAASLADQSQTPDQGADLNLKPGEVRILTR